MFRYRLACFIFAVSTAFACGQKTSQTESIANSAPNLADKIAEVKPSVVRIQAEAGPNQTSRGTGFIVNKQGVIATARHVICCINGTNSFYKGISLQWVISATENATGGDAVGNFIGTSAAVIDQDVENDLVLLRPVMDIMHTDFVAMSGMRAAFPNMRNVKRTSAKFDTHPLREGDPIFITGYPLDFSSLVTTSGAIASSEPAEGGHSLKNVYWADIHANHGNSGGPTFSSVTGKVIGVQAAIATAGVEKAEHLRYNSGIAYITPIK